MSLKIVPLFNCGSIYPTSDSGPPAAGPDGRRSKAVIFLLRDSVAFATTSAVVLLRSHIMIVSIGDRGRMFLRR